MRGVRILEEDRELIIELLIEQMTLKRKMADLTSAEIGRKFELDQQAIYNIKNQNLELIHRESAKRAKL
jgi:hypothetical protein